MTAAADWRPMEEYPFGPMADWIGELVDLKLEDGSEVRAQWRADGRTKWNGKVWAFWCDDGRFFAMCEPKGWRACLPTS